MPEIVKSYLWESVSLKDLLEPMGHVGRIIRCPVRPLEDVLLFRVLSSNDGPCFLLACL